MIGAKKSVYPIESESGESRAWDAIGAQQKKGRKFTSSLYDAPDMNAAIQEAERIEPNYLLAVDTLKES
jgi:hypothetical protein